MRSDGLTDVTRLADENVRGEAPLPRPARLSCKLNAEVLIKTEDVDLQRFAQQLLPGISAFFSPLWRWLTSRLPCFSWLLPVNVSVRMMTSDSDFYISPQLANSPSSPPPTPTQALPRRGGLAWHMPISHSPGLLPPVSQPASIILNVQFALPPTQPYQKWPLAFDTLQSGVWKTRSGSVQNMGGQHAIKVVVI